MMLVPFFPCPTPPFKALAMAAPFIGLPVWSSNMRPCIPGGRGGGGEDETKAEGEEEEETEEEERKKDRHTENTFSMCQCVSIASRRV